MSQFLKQQIRVPFQSKLHFAEIEPEPIFVKKVQIDESFPEDEANNLAEIESYNKHLFRPNTYLHKWWARRSGTTFRYILKYLQNNPTLLDFYKAGGLEGKIIFDPMMGGGTTLHEAIRLGANVIGIDIDPIPVLQAKASLTLSSIGHNKSVFTSFLNALRKRIDHLYRTKCPSCKKDSEIQFLLYGLRRKCECREVIVVDSLTLRYSNNHDVHICPDCRSVYIGNEHQCLHTVKRPLVVKGIKVCERCNKPFSDLAGIPYFKRYIPLSVIGICVEHGKFFKSADGDDCKLIAQATTFSENIDWGNDNIFEVPKGPKSDDLLNRGINSFLELFTPRQLLYLHSAIDSLPEIESNDRLWVALLISTSLDFNSLLCGYKGGAIRRPGAIRHVFAHHAYSFPYTALENNPVFSESTSGTLNRLFKDRIVKACKWATKPIETRIENDERIKTAIEGEVDGGVSALDWTDLKSGTRKYYLIQGDSAKINIPGHFVDFVVTDPPYYDSVQYSDLSNFFRVWLHKLLPQEANWQYNQLASAVSEGKGIGNQKYGKVLTEIWKKCRQALKKDGGRLVFTFHHWRHNAWSELTISLKQAGFFLINRYAVHSENPISVHIAGLNALKHDCILVFAPDRNIDNLTEWNKPNKIDTNDSYQFCRDCGSALGWFLLTSLNENEIREEWKQILGENGNGKTSG